MQYAKAPIVEAILELRFQTPVDIDLARKTADKFKADFPISEDQENLQVVLGPKGQISRQSDWQGRKRSNLDTTDILRVSTVSFTTMRLAPYESWDQLFERTKAQWPRVKKSLGKPKLIRLGCRYINRIDIPDSENPSDKFDLDDYLNFGPKIPDHLGVALNSFFLQATTPPSDNGFPIALRIGGTPSPLVNHTSFLLDIDVHDDRGGNDDDETIWNQFLKIREYKNKIFEACVTDRARKLFS